MPRKRGGSGISLERLVEIRGSNCHVCTFPITDPADRTRDHKVPYAVGGKNHRKNLLLAHRACNNARGTTSIEELKKIQDEARAIAKNDNQLRSYIMKHLKALKHVEKRILMETFETAPG